MKELLDILNGEKILRYTLSWEPGDGSETINIVIRADVKKQFKCPDDVRVDYIGTIYEFSFKMNNIDTAMDFILDLECQSYVEPD